MITSPALSNNENRWSYAGIGFQANLNTLLTSFTYFNQGFSDTVYLYDENGVVLHSISIPTGATAYVASIDWSLTAGTQYYLLKSEESNALYSDFNSILPSNPDISLTDTGIFSGNPPPPSNFGYSGNEYWVAFGDITTVTTAQVPETATVALISLGLVGMGFGKRLNRGQ
ncbi:PEP-CTERM sorting domain-containing protein [Candidatus Thiodictyon syntrophicum]|uniref:PEP-CTERM sorting domain-containing protein n=1 Tax=Candidatus Thiodictyon syntrophicum TaxID=1166950 RepID=UPI0012FE4A41|nr:PEP-CTERM sorting domain-containing protein [Candidatus Thiodictyon syntrophicum]